MIKWYHIFDEGEKPEEVLSYVTKWYLYSLTVSGFKVNIYLSIFDNYYAVGKSV